VSQTLLLKNFGDTNLKEQAKFAQDAAANASTFYVDNLQSLAANDYLALGDLGGPSCEIIQIQSVNTSTRVVTAASPLTQDHKRYEPINKLFGPQFRVYTAANVDNKPPAAASFSPLANSITPIDPDQLSTPFTDTVSDPSTWYRYVYLNPTTATVTDLAACPAMRYVSHYCTIASIRNAANLNDNLWIDDQTIHEKRVAAEDEVNSVLAGAYTLPLSEPYNETVVNIARELSVGLLLMSYPSSAAEGTRRAKDARAILARIKDKELNLTDVNGVNLAIDGGVSNVSGHPDESTRYEETIDSAGYATHAGDFKFNMDAKF
jgi:hypothetical protein